MSGMRLSLLWLWQLMAYRIWCRVEWSVSTESSTAFSASVFEIIWRSMHLIPLRRWPSPKKLLHLTSLQIAVFLEIQWISRCHRLISVFPGLSLVDVHLPLKLKEAQESFMFYQTVEC